MRKVELVKGIESSALGFGCAPILGSKGASVSRRALDMAFDNGITHFDLARSYGYGEAENFVGKVFGSKREKIVLASKFGIVANWKANIFKPIKPIIRKLKNSKPDQNNIDNTKQKSIADVFHNRIQINSLNMQVSLEKSLKALKTDYLDYFLIHEPLFTIENIDELYITANRLKEAGKIRAWGLTSMKDQLKLHSSYLEYFDIVQFNNSPIDIDYNEITQERFSKSNIFFSPLGGNRFGENMNANQKLTTLSADYPKSVTLCSMYSEKHLMENCKLF